MLSYAVNLNLKKESKCMKKLIALALSLVCIFALYGCGWNSQKEVATVISESVTKIDVTHFIGGKTTTWSVEGTDIDLLREWYNNLSYRYREFEKDSLPATVMAVKFIPLISPEENGPVFPMLLTGRMIVTSNLRGIGSLLGIRLCRL